MTGDKYTSLENLTKILSRWSPVSPVPVIVRAGGGEAGHVGGRWWVVGVPAVTEQRVAETGKGSTS